MTRKKVVRIGTSHYHVGHIVPAMVAKEMTYFEAEGLTDYELYFGGLIPGMVEGIALRRAMKEKGVDIVPDAKPSSVFQLATRGEDVCIVGVWRNRQDWQWYGAKGMKSLADLKGKKIGIRDFGGIGHTALKIQLKRSGLDPERDVVLVRGPEFHPNENPAVPLRRGDVDCVHVHAHDNKGLDKEGYPLLLESRKVYPGGRPDRVIIATRRMTEEEPDLLRAYLRATIRAYWFLIDYARNGDYLEALVRRLRFTCLDEEEAHRTGLEGGGRMALPFDGAPSPVSLQEMVEETKEMKEVGPDFNLSPFLRLEFVRQAFKELEERKELAGERVAVRKLYEEMTRAA